jgi:hypothetical protein
VAVVFVGLLRASVEALVRFDLAMDKVSISNLSNHWRGYGRCVRQMAAPEATFSSTVT